MICKYKDETYIAWSNKHLNRCAVIIHTAFCKKHPLKGFDSFDFSGKSGYLRLINSGTSYTGKVLVKLKIVYKTVI